MSVIDNEKYTAISPAEFFLRYREIAGFANPARALYQAVRELVENALDATDAHGILPSIKVVIRKADPIQDFYKVTVEDNGIGLPPHIVPEAFGRVLFSSKYVLRQTRGMFGLGVKVAALYAQMTTGKPIEVITSKPNLKFIYYFKLRIDVHKNEPVVLEKGSWRKTRNWHGTVVSLTLEGDWSRARSKILEYIARTAVATPYANIVLVTPDNEIVYYERVVNKLPKPPKEVKPHPHGIDLETLKKIINSTSYKTVYDLLVKNFQSIGEVTAKAVLKQAEIPSSINPKKLGETELLRLVETMKNYKKYKPPKADALSPLSSEIIVAGLKRMYNPEFVEAVTRRPSTYHGYPFIVEVGIAYGGNTPLSDKDKPVLLRYANKIPLLYDEGSDVITSVVKEDIAWSNYLVELPAPILVLVHICSTKVPFKGVGKESIADVPEVRREVKLGILEVARRLRRYLAKKIKEEEIRKKIVSIAKYIPEVVRALTIISDGPGVSREELEEKLVNIIVARTGLSSTDIKRVIDSVEIGA
ncbi:MAG: DNA topoisomerase VI subunit B [Thermoprotei archaeon]|nr:MAG: DNA topoisomerase VI subunit B [Thermoprotei archaeon]